MPKTSRMLPIGAINKIEPNVVRLQPRRAANDEDAASPGEVETLSVLMERASNAARQMKYFGMATKQFSFDELISSARRAGFTRLENPNTEEASFQWAGGTPDLIFSVSYRDPANISIVAESRADVFGLILTGYSHISTISVETDLTIEDRALGDNALLFRDMLLTFPNFDDLPAWARHPEGHMLKASGLIEMWRDGVSVSSLSIRALNSISARVSAFWKTLRDRSSR